MPSSNDPDGGGRNFPSLEKGENEGESGVGGSTKRGCARLLGPFGVASTVWAGYRVNKAPRSHRLLRSIHKIAYFCFFRLAVFPSSPVPVPPSLALNSRRNHRRLKISSCPINRRSSTSPLPPPPFAPSSIHPILTPIAPSIFPHRRKTQSRSLE